MTKRQMETTKYAIPSDNQTPKENGDENMKRLGGSGSGFLYKMLMPREEWFRGKLSCL